ncbi:S9 family peptidase [Hymenobacter cheonanensis]|uniref:S9 family peptidase n=1 Tax=Hymenobacter sp. CA2-7 TaxID=3063993 RepID=UPI0027124913|nr:S9 family peptidase [Hymenobacter sp. CA2-7]MDO7886722.1 S9 family peptidase [Hymenobacter sp. CA2-7]
MKILSTLWIGYLTTLAALSAQGQAASTSSPMSPPPIATVKAKQLTSPHGTRTDNYYWLNERDNPQVLSYLRQENVYTDQQMAPVKGLEEKLFTEMKGRIKEQDASVPYRDHGYYYYTRYETGGEYPLYCRKEGSLTAPEEIMLNGNEMGQGKAYFAIGGYEVSDDNQTLAYGTDSVSRRLYTLRFKNLKTGQLYPEKIANTAGSAVWAADNKTVFYAKKDVGTLLAYQVYRHTLGTDPSHDVLVYEEKDNTFGVNIARSKSRQYIGITLHSSLSSEYRYLEAGKPTGAFKVFLKREPDHLYEVQDANGEFYVLTNWEAPNFRVMATPLSNTNKAQWEDVVPQREDVFIEQMELFKNYLVLNERAEGLREMRVINLGTEIGQIIPFRETAYTTFIGANPEFDTPTLRLTYTSFTTPTSTYDYNMDTQKLTLLKEQPVLGGFNKEDYVTERVFVKARDGKEIPLTIVYKKGFKKDGNGPLLQYAYGSYGLSMDPTFSSARLSLLNRGFAYALCSIRGGQELGRQWFEDGRMLHKKNSFTDFIDCSLYLIKNKYTAPAKLFAQGGSAGGLLMGAVVNMRPDLYKGVIAAVPFVDVVTTMSDASIPLTTGEYDQWGNPAEKKYYDYMLSYSPYDNVKDQNYPNMLVLTGLHDSQVQYFEPAKWVAKLRATKTDNHLLLLHTDMEAGHGGASGRFKALHDVARQYAFLFLLLGPKTTM